MLLEHEGAGGEGGKLGPRTGIALVRCFDVDATNRTFLVLYEPLVDTQQVEQVHTRQAPAGKKQTQINISSLQSMGLQKQDCEQCVLTRL